MNQSTNLLTRILPAAVLAVLAASACSTTGGAGRSPATAAESAKQRWQAVIDQDYAKAYAFLAPGQRSLVTEEDFAKSMRSRPSRWLEAEVKGEECPEVERCVVSVEVKVEASIPAVKGQKTTFTSPLTEAWVKRDGRWYYVPKHGVY